MKKLIKASLAALCSALLLTNAVMPAVSAEEVDEELVFPSGITHEDLDFLLDFYENDIDMAEDKWGATAIGFFHGDEVLCTDYFAYSDAELQAKADESSVFEWGEVSELLVWVSALQLWEQGSLDLEGDIRDCLPDGFLRRLAYDEPITILDLMNGTAGWQELVCPVWKTDAEAIRPLGEALRAVEPKQVCRPGEAAVDQMYNAAVAAYVIECITGQDYSDHVREHILEPLGMEHTSVNAAHTDNAWVCEQRRKMRTYESAASLIDKGSCLSYLTLYPAGSAVSTLDDLITFAQALVCDDTPLFRDPETQAELFEATAFYGDSDIPLCAHGLHCKEYAVRTYSLDGATAASHARLLLDPVSQLGLAVMIEQSDTDNHYFNDFSEWCFGTLSPKKFGKGAESARLSGYYLPSSLPQRGMLRIVGFLSAAKAERFEPLSRIGSGVYQRTYDTETMYGQLQESRESKRRLIDSTHFNAEDESAMLIGVKTLSDGSTEAVISSPMSSEPVHAVRDRFYTAELCILTAYVLLAVASVYLMFMRRKLKKHGRLKKYSGSALLSAGQTSWLVSVLFMFVTYVIFVSGGTMTFSVSAVIGISQLICTAFCCLAAVAAVIGLVREKSGKWRYAANMLCNITAIAAVVCFETYNFWNI